MAEMFHPYHIEACGRIGITEHFLVKHCYDAQHGSVGTESDIVLWSVGKHRDLLQLLVTLTGWLYCDNLYQLSERRTMLQGISLQLTEFQAEKRYSQVLLHRGMLPKLGRSPMVQVVAAQPDPDTVHQFPLLHLRLRLSRGQKVQVEISCNADSQAGVQPAAVLFPPPCRYAVDAQNDVRLRELD